VPTTTPTSDLIEVLEDSEVIGPDSGSEMKSTVNSELSPDEISRLPRIRDLSSEQQASVPEIRFSGHLYSSKAESRSVRFGDAKYKEGDWLNNRIQLQRITEDGVIFELNGAAFYMSSLEDWLGY
jgi:general secretion pathway protein B